MEKKFSLLLTILFGIIIIYGCNSNPDYETLVKQGLESGEEHNELFLSYELGMTRDEFYEISWDLNSREVISGLVKIDYPFNDLKSRATKRFFPEFIDDRISKIPVDVHYHSWAPWNEEFSSDSLVLDLVEYYEDKFNTDFHLVYVPHLEKEAYVSVQGNRAITVSISTEMIARVEFIDLNHFQYQDSE